MKDKCYICGMPMASHDDGIVDREGRRSHFFCEVVAQAAEADVPGYDAILVVCKVEGPEEARRHLKGLAKTGRAA